MASAFIVGGGVSQVIPPKLNVADCSRSQRFLAGANLVRNSSVSSRTSVRRFPLAFSTCRWSHDDRDVIARPRKMMSILLNQRTCVLTRSFPQQASAGVKLTCINHISRGRNAYSKLFTSRFSSDKSTFHSLKFSSRSTFKPVQCAAVGPDEPHAVSLTCPDGTLDKQAVDYPDPEGSTLDFGEFLHSELPSHPNLHRGQLKNGLRYIILPNKFPLNRFEAHLEVHAGSIDEEEDEQGIAHMIEHVVFLGSKKRDNLLGTGARSNAYTDFHHTVFYIHSPTHTKESEGDLLPSVLDALNEIAFCPKFLASRVEKERRAILSELQMMNTIEYRVDCQILQYLNSENKLSRRFPIGLEEQIKKWDADKVRKFHERWYFPANATLYIVGHFDNIPKTISQIEAVFGQTGLEKKAVAPPSATNAFGTMANFFAP